MKKYVFASLLSFISLWCSGNTGYEIEGTVDNSFNGKYIHIYGIDWSRLNTPINDSVLVANNTFHFTGKIATPGLLVSIYERQGGWNTFTQLYIENRKMKLEIKGNKWFKKENILVSNAPIHTDYLALKEITQAKENERGRLHLTLDSMQQAHPDSSFRNIQVTLEFLKNEIISLQKAFIKSHPKSYISLTTLCYTLNKDTEVEVLLNGLNAQLKKLPESVNLLAEIKNRKAIQLGKSAPIFASYDTTGKEITLDRFKNSFVLLDFWASWCKPCIESIPDLKKFKERNSAVPLEIIGISLDTDKAKWMAAISKYSLNWQHVSDLKGWDGSTGKLYNIDAIPKNILIDTQGKIVAIDINLDTYTIK